MQQPLNQPDQLSEMVSHALFFDWDPIGVADFPEARDEYDPYVADICTLLKSRAAEAELISYLQWLEVEHMGLPGDQRRRMRFARELLRIRDQCIGGIC